MLYSGTLSLLAGTIATTALSPAQPLWTTLLLIPWASIGQGLFFPTCTIATLAINVLDDQAVVVTTLGLLRSLGAIHGVAVSSWIFQNSLPVYLDRDVTAKTPELKQDIITAVRKSVHAIAGLKPAVKHQVIHAYSQALRVTFASGIFWAVIVGVLTVTTTLPRLQRQDEKDQDEDEEEEGDDGGRGDEEMGMGKARRSGSRRGRSFRNGASSVGGAGDEERALVGGDGIYEEEADYDRDSGSETEERQLRGEPRRQGTLKRRTSHLEALQLGRRASHDTTL